MNSNCLLDHIVCSKIMLNFNYRNLKIWDFIALVQIDNSVVGKCDGSNISISQRYYTIFTNILDSKSSFKILFPLIYYSLFNNLKILKYNSAGNISLVHQILNRIPKICHPFQFLKTIIFRQNILKKFIYLVILFTSWHYFWLHFISRKWLIRSMLLDCSLKWKKSTTEISSIWVRVRLTPYQNNKQFDLTFDLNFEG